MSVKFHLLSFYSVLMPQKKQDRLQEDSETPPDVKVSKAELRAQHAELNKKIWESAWVANQLIGLPTC
jgi:hypothetical protein